MNNQYFLLRHGETIYQTKKKKYVYPWPERLPIRLTRKGENAIKKVAKQLKRADINKIYASDIYRTRQTAEIVAKELGLKINLDKRLQDTKHGIYSGKTREEFYRDFPDPSKRFSKGPKGGESWNDIKKRVVSFIKEVDKKYKNKRILIIGHGDVLWLSEGIIKHMTNQELLDVIFLKKTYIKVGEFRKL